MNDIYAGQILHLIVIALACFFFASMCYVSATYFKVQDDGAKFGKRLISVLALCGIAYILWQMITQSSRPWSISLLASVIFAIAIGVFFSAKSAATIPLDFAMSNRTPFQLVTRGPYRHVRHPFYTSYRLAWVASLVQVQDWISFGIFWMMLAIYLKSAISEEKSFKNSQFKLEYLEYTNRTGMFFPSVRMIFNRT